MIVNLVLFLAIVFSLVWARLRFFKVESGTHLLGALAYDVAVLVQMVMTLYLMLNAITTVTPFSNWKIILTGITYFLALILFWWAIYTSKSLDFAFSNKVKSIVTSGPYGIVRHPFYVSYILVWLANSLLFNSSILWITLVFLVAFYMLSASKEEKVIRASEYSTEYKKYQQEVGMFLPRIPKWKQSNSES